MRRSLAGLAAALFFAGMARAHAISMSSGELRVAGTGASFELRIPAYEIASVQKPETTLLDQFHFGDARRTSSSCEDDSGTYLCRANYEFPKPIPDKIDVECTLYEVTVPNHVHLLYAVQGANSDQVVMDQSVSQAEIRFRPPTTGEIVLRDTSAGIVRLLKSPSAWLFLIALALASRGKKEAAILAFGFLISEWIARPLGQHLPLWFSREFLEAVFALTVAYLAVEIVFLPDNRARWMIVPILGIAHGLPFAAFPPLYLAGAEVIQIVVLAFLALATQQMPEKWRTRGGTVLLVIGLGWFVRMLMP